MVTTGVWVRSIGVCSPVTMFPTITGTPGVLVLCLLGDAGGLLVGVSCKGESGGETLRPRLPREVQLPTSGLFVPGRKMSPHGTYTRVVAAVT